MTGDQGALNQASLGGDRGNGSVKILPEQCALDRNGTWRESNRLGPDGEAPRFSVSLHSNIDPLKRGRGQPHSRAGSEPAWERTVALGPVRSPDLTARWNYEPTAFLVCATDSTAFSPPRVHLPKSALPQLSQNDPPTTGNESHRYKLEVTSNQNKYFSTFSNIQLLKQ